jgi:hypothetical protein
MSIDKHVIHLPERQQYPGNLKYDGYISGLRPTWAQAFFKAFYSLDIMPQADGLFHPGAYLAITENDS